VTGQVIGAVVLGVIVATIVFCVGWFLLRDWDRYE